MRCPGASKSKGAERASLPPAYVGVGAAGHCRAGTETPLPAANPGRMEVRPPFSLTLHPPTRTFGLPIAASSPTCPPPQLTLPRPCFSWLCCALVLSRSLFRRLAAAPTGDFVVAVAGLPSCHPRGLPSRLPAPSAVLMTPPSPCCDGNLEAHDAQHSSFFIVCALSRDPWIGGDQSWLTFLRWVCEIHCVRTVSEKRHTHGTEASRPEWDGPNAGRHGRSSRQRNHSRVDARQAELAVDETPKGQKCKARASES